MGSGGGGGVVVQISGFIFVIQTSYRLLTNLETVWGQNIYDSIRHKTITLYDTYNWSLSAAVAAESVTVYVVS